MLIAIFAPYSVTLDFTSNNCILGLSPMDDITDYPFRVICKEFGADILYTEFIAAEGINHNAFKGKRKMLFTDEMRPIGIQIFGADKNELLKCLAVVERAEPDFIDLNWGCPVRKVADKGAGSGMLKDTHKLLEITESIVRQSHFPVTVKTRIGFDKENICIETLAQQLQDVGVAMLAIHGRTRSQMYTGQANWSIIGAVKKNTNIRIPIYGNGDIDSPNKALQAKQLYDVDGILIGRAAIGNPWIFEQTKRLMNGLPERSISIRERVDICRRHLQMSIDFFGEHTGLIVMKRHYASYFKSLPNFKQFRTPLFNNSSRDQVYDILNQITDYYSPNDF